MRLSRGCYDKFRRCPGWAGGGMRSAKVDRCKDGTIQMCDSEWEPKRFWQFRFLGCNKCDVRVWPYWTRYLAPSVWGFRLHIWRMNHDL